MSQSIPFGLLLKAMLLCAALATQVSAKENIRTMGSKLFTSTKNWQVLSGNSTGIYYFDPDSLVRNGFKWEISTTYVNNSNQYSPELTQTFEVDCLTHEIQSVGWRINTYLHTHREALGRWADIPKKSPVQKGTLGSVIDNWVCGFNFGGVTYYGATSYYPSESAKNNILTFWVAENRIFVSDKDANIKKLDILYYSSSSGKFAQYNLYLKCDSSSFLFGTDGRATSNWTVAEPRSPMMFFLDRGCRGRAVNYSSVIQSFDVPSLVASSEEADGDKPLDYRIDEAKRKCIDLGYAAGTTKFGQCVLKLSK